MSSNNENHESHNHMSQTEAAARLILIGTLIGAGTTLGAIAVTSIANKVQDFRVDRKRKKNIRIVK